MKRIGRILLILFLIIVGAVAYNYPKLNMISGYAAKNMASSVFVANRTEAYTNQADNNVPLIKLAKTKTNPLSKTALSSVFGLMERKAVYRNGLGTVLVNDEYETDALLTKPNRNIRSTGLPFPYGDREQKDTLFENIDYDALQEAVNKAFANPNIQKTRTVLVVYKDKIIAEKYTDGFDKNSKILGWSMTKSVLGTLYGILQYNGKINTSNTTDIVEWQQDDRKHITLNHLLRMQSGLEWKEDYTTISDVTKMLFLDSDMTVAQRDKLAVAKPTEIWNYSSGTSNLLSGILRTQFKTHQEYLNFPYASLIDKIGMNSMLIETDIKGNYVGSSYAWATTRDWAKFGLLYLHKGNWNGQQIFDPEWATYVSTPTQHSNGTYGAHFWLNAEGKFPDAPRDMYSANGYQGQRVFIVPSKDLVVVRTGLSIGGQFDFNTFLGGITKAIN